MDFIIDFLISNSINFTFVMIELREKIAYFILCLNTNINKEIIKLFY